MEIFSPLRRRSRLANKKEVRAEENNVRRAIKMYELKNDYVFSADLTMEEIAVSQNTTSDSMRRYTKMEKRRLPPQKNGCPKKMRPCEEDLLVSKLDNLINNGEAISTRGVMNLLKVVSEESKPSSGRVEELRMSPSAVKLFLREKGFVTQSAGAGNDEYEKPSKQVFEDFWKTLDELKIKKTYDSEMVFNMDESFVSTGKSLKSLEVWKRPGKKVKYHRQECSSHLTLIACVSGANIPMRDAYVGSKKELRNRFFRELWKMPPVYYDSGCGWITSQILCLWLEQVFVPTIMLHRDDRPVLLITDCHRTRLDSVFQEKLKEHKIDLLLMPSGCTDVFQPLDLAIFRPYKEALRQDTRPGTSVEVAVLKSIDAFSKAAHSSNIESGWKKSRLLATTWEEFVEGFEFGERSIVWKEDGSNGNFLIKNRKQVSKRRKRDASTEEWRR